jgi:hypothetical protein
MSGSQVSEAYPCGTCGGPTTEGSCMIRVERGRISSTQTQFLNKIRTYSTSELTGSKIRPNIEKWHNSVRPRLIFLFSTQKTRFEHTNTIPQKNLHSSHFWMNGKQNTSKYGNNAQLSSPMVNFAFNTQRTELRAEVGPFIRFQQDIDKK